MATIDGIDITSLTFQEGSAPTTPASTKWKLYTKTDGLYLKDDAGAETGPFVDSTGSTSNLQAGKVKRTAGDVSTTSTSFVDVTGMSVTITTGARRCLVAAIVTGYSNNVAGSMAVTLDIDGADQGGATAGLITLSQHATASESMDMSFTFLTDVLTAASHTFKLRMRSFNVAHTFTINANDPPCVLSVVELYTG